MCNKCSNYHNICEDHHQYSLDKDINEIFIDICNESNHPNKLQYFCKNHNKLVCASCITKLEGEGNGQHKDCNICFTKNIKEEKKNKLNENIKFLEDLSNNLENSIDELKKMFEKINESKEELKLKIQKIFTTIRNTLNDREDELLLEVDNKYNGIFCNEDIIRDCEKMPNKIKLSLEKGKSIDKKWNDNKLTSIINDCINIEENIKNIHIINDNIKNYKLINNIYFDFFPDEENSDDFIQSVKNFGYIINLDSLILKNKNDINKFFKLISIHLDVKNIKNVQPLYKSSKDGLNYSNMVNKINNKSNLIFLFFTGNERIFGVYIKSKLENIISDKYYKDENAFIFSLDNNKTYKILMPEKAIKFFDTDNLVLIGNTGNGNGFYYFAKKICDETLLNKPKIYDFQQNKELTHGLKELTELEILELQFTN